MADNRGTPLDGDRGAKDTVNHPEFHAKGIKDGTLKRHLPAPSAAGTYARDDGNNWLAQLGLLFTDFTGHVRGSIFRGGAGNWEVYDAKTALQFLVGNGTDVISRVLANGDLPDPLAFKTAPSTLTIAAGVVTASQNLHIIAAQTGIIDDLDTVNGLVDRQWLLLKADAGDTITVTHGTGNIHFDSGDNFELAGDSWLLLFCDGTNVVALGAGGISSIDAADVTYTPSNDSNWNGDADPGNVDDALDQLAARAEGFETGGVKLLFSQVVDITVANTTDETSILGSGRGSKTIPGNTFDIGTAIRLTLHGYFSDTGTPTLNVRIKLGGTEVCSTGAVALPSGISSLGWSLNVDIVCRSTGGSGTVIAGGIFEFDDDSGRRMIRTSTTTVDTTAGLLVDVTKTWGTAAAGNTSTCQMATIELLKADNLAVAAPSGLTAVEV